MPSALNRAMCETVSAVAALRRLQAASWTLERIPPLELELEFGVEVGGEKDVGVPVGKE